MSTTDFYRWRLKRAGWGWMEQSRMWGCQGKHRKDRKSGRCEKRGARLEEQGELRALVAEATDAATRRLDEDLQSFLDWYHDNYVEHDGEIVAVQPTRQP